LFERAKLIIERSLLKVLFSFLFAVVWQSNGYQPL
jgi:hypothetical protein